MKFFAAERLEVAEHRPARDKKLIQLNLLNKIKPVKSDLLNY
jgi:hypothetical protein